MKYDIYCDARRTWYAMRNTYARAAVLDKLQQLFTKYPALECIQWDQHETVQPGVVAAINGIEHDTAVLEHANTILDDVYATHTAMYSQAGDETFEEAFGRNVTIRVTRDGAVDILPKELEE